MSKIQFAVLLLFGLIFFACGENTSSDNASKSEENNVDLPPSELGFYETYTLGEYLAYYDDVRIVLDSILSEGNEEQDASTAGAAVDLTLFSNRSLADLIVDVPDQQNQAILLFAMVENRIAIDSVLQVARSKKLLPEELDFMWSAAPIDFLANGKAYGLYIIRIPSGGEAIITNADLKDVSIGMNDTEVTLNVSMTKAGTDKWSLMTQKNKGKQIAMVIDNLVYSAPIVMDAISVGNTMISGNFTIEEAKELKDRLKQTIE